MKFKGYAWPHNPRVYSVAATRDVASHKIPGGDWYSRDMGGCLRVVSGEGEFTGEDAYEQFKQLYSLFSEGGEGQLIHPIWKTMTAYFTALTLVQEPKADYVYYKFTFTECGRDADSAALTVVNDASIISPEVAIAIKKLKYLSYFAEPAAKYRVLAASKSGARIYHAIRRGETVWTVCALYGISYAVLIGLNPSLKNPHLLTVGVSVRIV